LFLGVAFAAQLEAVRAGSPEPVSADPLAMEGRSDAAAVAVATPSPNLEPAQQAGATSGADAELWAANPVSVAQQPVWGRASEAVPPAGAKGLNR
ncbi:MAG TPA: hypothetical protein VF328_11370, partial [Mycobacterium sp.]